MLKILMADRKIKIFVIGRRYCFLQISVVLETKFLVKDVLTGLGKKLKEL